MTAELASIRKQIDNVEYEASDINDKLFQLKIIQSRLLLNIAESLDGLNRK